jgi:hypothetical protein
MGWMNGADRNRHGFSKFDRRVVVPGTGVKRESSRFGGWIFPNSPTDDFSLREH